MYNYLFPLATVNSFDNCLSFFLILVFFWRYMLIIICIRCSHSPISGSKTSQRFICLSMLKVVCTLKNRGVIGQYIIIFLYDSKRVCFAWYQLVMMCFVFCSCLNHSNLIYLLLLLLGQLNILDEIGRPQSVTTQHVFITVPYSLLLTLLTEYRLIIL